MNTGTKPQTPKPAQAPVNVPAKATEPKPTELATVSERFVKNVERQFVAELGASIKWNPLQQTLAQHLYIKIDAALKALEAKRLKDNKGGSPYTWDNVNLTKLAVDAVHRVALGLDALIANHIHPVPYFNSKIGKYDLDLRIGYMGKDFTRRKLSLDPIVDIVYKLVYETDEFTPLFKSRTNELESYEHNPTSPFNPGKVIGGFGYIAYEDPKKNRLVIVTQRDFDRAQGSAQTQDFWGQGKSDVEMKLKTVVHRTTEKIALDPGKVNMPSLTYVESQELEGVSMIIDAEAFEMANKEPMAIDPAPQSVPTHLNMGQGEAVPVGGPQASLEEEQPY